MAVATVVAVLIGRMIRLRDLQVPRGGDGASLPGPTDPPDAGPGRLGETRPVVDQPRRRGGR